MNRFERHPILTALCFGAVFLLLGIGALEWYLRASGQGDALVNDPRFIGNSRHVVLREYRPNSHFRFTPPEIRRSSGDAVAAQYSVETDADGFIKPSRVHATPDVTIAFLGGSTTECLFVAPEARFPVTVGQLLERELGLKINTINAARSGNNSQHSMLVLQAKLLPLKPDIVVMMHNVNDLGVLSRYSTYWNDSSDYALVREEKRGLETGLRMIRDATIGYSYQIIKQSMRQIGAMFRGRPEGTTETGAAAGGGVAPGADTWAKTYESSLTQMVESAKAWGIRPVLMTQVAQASATRARTPGTGQYLADEALARRGFTADSFDSTHAYFNEIARHVAGTHGAGLIDLAAAGPWDGHMLYDGLHFSEPGSRRAAEIISQALATQIRDMRRASVTR